jgi:hypothetical protein
MSQPAQSPAHTKPNGSSAGIGPLRPRSNPPRVSLRESINAKCKECIFDPLSGRGNWRQQVTACTSHACPLYPVRPTSEGRHEA